MYIQEADDMTANTKNNFELVNIVEELVKTSTRDHMNNIDMCQCEKCYLDACALALNKLPSHYVTTNRGSLLAMIPQRHQVEERVHYDVEVLKALLFVKNNPRHE